VRRLAVIGLAGIAALAGAPAASAAKVDVLVVGSSRVLRGPVAVTLKARTVEVGARRCAVGRATPLSALAGTGARLRVRDQGACGPRARDAGGLYVFAIGPDRERGRSGWVYKVGHRAGSTGAGDPTGPFGTGKGLRAGQRLLWFWCTLDQAQGCQRTLDARPDRSAAAPGEALRVTVRGYDDHGAGVAVAGATVRLGSATAVSGADGVATLTVPAGAGRLRLQATRAGMVRAFPTAVTVR
jgi:hypothetical protein